MTKTMLGVIHPYKDPSVSKSKFSMLLTVYNWINGSLKLKARIKIHDGFKSKSAINMISQMHYDESADLVTVITSDFWGEEYVKPTRVIEF